MSFQEMENKLNNLKASSNLVTNLNGNTDRVFHKKQSAPVGLDLTILGGSRPRDQMS